MTGSTLPLLAIALAVVLRLFGAGRDWLPSAGRLALLLLVVHLLVVASDRERFERWRRLARASWFEMALAVICLLALAVRLPGFSSDLGHTPLDIDEHRFASNVQHFFLTGELLHDTVEHYPGAVFWLFSAASFLSYLRGLAGGMTTAVTALPVEAFVQACRFANIIVGALTVGVTGLIGWRISGPAAGLIAALLVAVVPLAVDVTVLSRNDPGMVLVVVATTWAALVYCERGQSAWIAGAGVLAGIAGAIKYSAVFAIVPVLIAASAGAPKGRRLRAATVALFAFLVAVAVTNHFMWADFPNFLRQLSDQVAITGPGHWAATANPAAFYAGTLISMGVGWLLALLAAAFAAYTLTTRRSDLWIVVSFPLLYVWFMTGRPSQFARWVYPMLPFVAVAGASALMTAFDRLSTRPTWVPVAASVRALRVASASLVLVALLQPVWAGAVALSRRVTTPTHVLAEAWVRQHAGAGSVVLVMRDWLDFDDVPFEVRRVTSFRGLLDSGVERLAGCDFVVVPEPLFGHPTLRQLEFLARFQADPSFGGNRGFDFEVYSVPKLPVAGSCGRR